MKKTEFSVNSICQKIWDFEKKYDLFSLQVNNVKFWQVIRFRLYYQIVEKTNLFGNPHPQKRKSFLNILRQSFLSLTTKNPFFILGDREYCVMPHPRKVNGVDLYSSQIFDELPKDKTFKLYKHGTHEKDSYTLDIFLCAVIIMQRIRGLFPRKGNLKKHINIIHKLQNNMQDCFGYDGDLEYIIQKNVFYFSFEKIIYKCLFRLKRVKKLYIVIAYTQHAAVAAAQELGIHVIELQHGTFTKYHLGYSYPIAPEKIPYFPNELYCFGEFWPETTPLPTRCRTKIIGAPYLDAFTSNTDTSLANKKSNQVVVASQGAIGKYLFSFALKCAKMAPDYHFIYRLHPSEDLEHYQSQMIEHNAPKNMVLSAKSPDIFSLIAESEFQLGVFSTTLLEGMKLGCKVILVDMPGIEYMTPVINKGDAILIKSEDEICAALKNAPICKNPDYYYK